MEFFPFPTSEKRSICIYLASDDNEKCKLQFQTFVMDALKNSFLREYLNLLKKLTLFYLDNIAFIRIFWLLRGSIKRHHCVMSQNTYLLPLILIADSDNNSQQIICPSWKIMTLTNCVFDLGTSRDLFKAIGEISRTFAKRRRNWICQRNWTQFSAHSRIEQ